MSLDPQDAPRPLGEISQGPSAFEQFLDRNQKNLVILSCAIAVATAAYLIYQGIATSKEHTAGAELFKAKDLPALQQIVEKYRGTAAAGTAAIPLAERQWTEAQQDAAIATLKSFISANPDHPARPSAQASLAAKLKAQGKTPEAKALFQTLADDPAAAFLAPYALIGLGDLAKASGETDQAEKSYQKAKTSFPGNSFTTTIDQRLALLKAELPVEIDPPPAPAPTAGTPPTVPGAPPALPGTPTTIPGAPLALPGAPPAVPGGTQPAIPGLPPTGQDSSETDVPPVANPFLTTPKPAPVEAPDAATPPAKPETPPAKPEAPAAAETPPAKPEAPPAKPEAPPAKPEAPPAKPETSPATPATAPTPVQDPPAAPRNDPSPPAAPASPPQP